MPEPADSPDESSWLARAGASDELRARTAPSSLAADPPLDALLAAAPRELEPACGAEALADLRGPADGVEAGGAAAGAGAACP